MDNVIADIVKHIKKYTSVHAVILFGSRARGDANDRSDIDIAVVCPDIANIEWLRLCSEVEELNTLLKIDLISYTKSPAELQHNIDKEGVILYERR